MLYYNFVCEEIQNLTLLHAELQHCNITHMQEYTTMLFTFLYITLIKFL